MRTFARKFRVMLVAHYALALTYRAEVFIWALSGTLPLILAGVWIEAGKSGGRPLEPEDYARYFFCTFIVRQLTLVWVVWEFEGDVVQGRLSSKLLMPIDPMCRYLAQHLSERVARIPVLGLLGGLFFVLYWEQMRGWRPGLSDLGWAALAIVGTFALRFTVQYTFGLLAFWTERAHSVEQLWYLPYLYLSGLIAPLEEFPKLLQQIVLFTPFPYLIYFPSRVMMGGDLVHFSLGQGFAVMLGWTVVVFILQRILWRLGLKHYSAMGA